jgi:glutaredoxin
MSRTSFRHGREDNDLVSVKDVILKIKTKEYVILYSPWCSYSRSALGLFKNYGIVPEKIDIETVNGSINEIRSALSNDRNISFPSNFSTRPMIFHNGKFVGGYDELIDYLQ